MKAYSIGRESGCDIIINDSTDVISRRHAILNVSPTGKMTIIDQSQNGTYVNGIRISSNVPVPVTRKDNISFAHVSRLDWNMVPKPYNGLFYGAIAVIAVVAIGFGVFVGLDNWQMGTDSKTSLADTTKVEKNDSVNNEEKVKDDKKEETKTQNEKEKEDKKQDKVAKPDAKPEKKTSRKQENNSSKAESLCPTCNKPISKCEHKGKHPENTTRGDR